MFSGVRPGLIVPGNSIIGWYESGSSDFSSSGVAYPDPGGAYIMNKADLELLVRVGRKAVPHIEKASTVHDVSRQDAIAALRMRKELFPVSTISFVG